MSLIGVYPDINLMTIEQLKEYVIFLEAQAVTKECDQENRIEYLEKILTNYRARLKKYE